jgi:putative membrane protein
MSKFDFTIPQRESPVVIILILVKSISSLVRQFTFPFITIYLLGKGSNNEHPFFLYFFIFITIISLIRSFISYFRKQYYVNEDELIVKSGALSNKTISIPFERIQSINFEQNLIHRLFNVVKLKIDTAGSSQKEAELDGLNIKKAEAIRTLLLDEKHEALSKINLLDQIDSYKEEDQQIANGHETILSLSLKDLIKASLFENHFNSLALIFAFFWYIFINAREVGIDAEDYVDRIPLVYDILIYIILIVVTIIITILISFGRTIISYYNLSFERLSNGFRIKKGLFNYVTLSALDHKIQKIGWSDTWLKKKIGIYDIRLKQASIEKVESKESIIIPGANLNHIHSVIGHLYPDFHEEAISYSAVNNAYLKRRIFFSLLFTFIFSILSIVFDSGEALLFFIFSMFMLPLYFTYKYKKLKYGFCKNYLRLKGGIFGDSNVVMPIFKIQGMEKSQSPYQRKRNLVSLLVHTASGAETIPYISTQDANEIIDFFLYKSESDNRSWI